MFLSRYHPSKTFRIINPLAPACCSSVFVAGSMHLFKMNRNVCLLKFHLKSKRYIYIQLTLTNINTATMAHDICRKSLQILCVRPDCQKKHPGTLDSHSNAPFSGNRLMQVADPTVHMGFRLRAQFVRPIPATSAASAKCLGQIVQLADFLGAIAIYAEKMKIFEFTYIGTAE